MGYFPTVYDYYTKDGIKSGLKAEGDKFELNGKPIKIYSGAIHYFRVHPDYWSDRLRKLRAAGLICVETYIPWNLHEPEQGKFEFGASRTDFEEFCDIAKFLKTAKELDLLVIIRPGPYICAEWEFGGLPSWLLNCSFQPSEIRTHNAQFMEKVENYFGRLFEVLVPHQFTNGGPIIAFQIENEYGNVKEKGQSIDVKYLELLKGIYLKNGIKELLFTSDTPSNGKEGTLLPDVLYTANFQSDAKKELDILKSFQPNRPCMVMEFWTGWYDHWGQEHETRREAVISDTLFEILEYPASVNFYMFHGGTNWGFMNGGDFENNKDDNSNIKLVTTSYDYDAPIAENGDYGEKYFMIKEMIEKYSPVTFNTPLIPFLSGRVAYDTIPIKCMDLDDLLQKVYTRYHSSTTSYMEKFGQSYGYIVYRKTNLTIPEGSFISISGHVKDTIMVLINHKLISPKLTSPEDLNKFGYWKLNNSTLTLPETTNAVLDIVVENFGRSNYGKLYQFNQNKGIDEDYITLNARPLRNWTIYILNFERSFNNSLNPTKLITYDGPKLYKGVLNIGEEDDKKDTYIDMRDWTKGIVIVNGFVLGRYFKFGPQRTLYLPAPFLKIGSNVILIFEHFSGPNSISFCKEPIFNEPIIL